MNPPLFSLRNRDHHNSSKAQGSPTSPIHSSSPVSTFSKGNSKVQPIINEGLDFLEQTSRLLDSNRDVLDVKHGHYNERAALLAHSAPVANKLTKGRLRPKEFHDSAQHLLTELREAVSSPTRSGGKPRRRAKASSIAGETMISSYPDTLISPTVSQVYPNGKERGPFWLPKGHALPKSSRDPNEASGDIHDATRSASKTRHKRSDTVPAHVTRHPSHSSFVQGSSTYPYGGLAQAHGRPGQSHQYASHRHRDEEDPSRSVPAGEPEYRPSSRSHYRGDDHYRSRHHYRDREDHLDTAAMNPAHSEMSDKTRWPGHERERGRPVEQPGRSSDRHRRRHHSEDVYSKDRQDRTLEPEKERDRRHHDRDRGVREKEHDDYERKRRTPREEGEDRYHSSRHDPGLRHKPSYGRYGESGPRYYHDRDRDKERSRKDDYYYDKRRPGKYDYYDSRHDKDRGYHTSSRRRRGRDDDEDYYRNRDGKEHNSSRTQPRKPSSRAPTPPPKVVTPSNISLPASTMTSPTHGPVPLTSSKTLPHSRTPSMARPITPTPSLPPVIAQPQPPSRPPSRGETIKRYDTGSSHPRSRGLKRESLPNSLAQQQQHPPSSASSFSWRPRYDSSSQSTIATNNNSTTTPIPRGFRFPGSAPSAAAKEKTSASKRKKKSYSMAYSEVTNTPTIIPYPVGDDGASGVYEEMGVVRGKNTGRTGSGSGKKGGVLGKMFGLGSKKAKSKFVEVF